MLNFRRLWAMARKEVIQLKRDTRSLILAFLLPVLLLILFGYAITWDVRDIKTAVVDYDNTQQSRELIDAFRSSGYFDIIAHKARTRDVNDLLASGDIRIALVVPVDFAKSLQSHRTASVQALVDGSDANTAEIVLAYAKATVLTYSARVLLEGRTYTAPIVAQSRVWYNEELTSRNMIVPGLVAVIMMIIASMLTSLTVAREWERGTMEQLAATPVSRLEVVLGKLLPYVAIGMIDVAVISVLGVVLFDVPLRGSALLLMVLALAFTTGTLAFGIFISAVARSQLLATQIAMITSFLPAFLLSGFMFAIDVMPLPLQLVTFVIPARYFLVVTRGIFLKGVGVEVLYIQGLLMILYGLAGTAMAVKVFKKELV